MYVAPVAVAVDVAVAGVLRKVSTHFVLRAQPQFFPRMVDVERCGGLREVGIGADGLVRKRRTDPHEPMVVLVAEIPAGHVRGVPARLLADVLGPNTAMTEAQEKPWPAPRDAPAAVH